MNAVICRFTFTASMILLLASSLSAAQSSSGTTNQPPDENAEALVNCPTLIQPEPLTPYGFAQATLVSLWYARNAAESGSQIKETAKTHDNYFSWLTAMMRIVKSSNNDFICAKRAVKPFAVKETGENISTASALLLLTYDAHINIDNRLLDLLKNMGNTDQATLADQLSTLQTERGQRWADLVQPTQIALMSLVDLKRPDARGKATRLIITKAQKKELLDWANEHFSEFRNGTPRDKWSEPAKTAELYFTLFKGRTCSDE